MVGGRKGGWAVKKGRVWTLNSEGDPVGGSKKLEEVWQGLGRDPRAGFRWKNGLVFLFRGSLYWRYNGTKLEPGFPKRISKGFTGLPPFMDLALVRGNSIVFVKRERWVELL